MRIESGVKQAGEDREAKPELASASTVVTVGFLGLFRERYLMATLLAIGVQMAQQLTGINAIMFYSSDMFKRANVQDNLIQYAVCATGLIVVIVTIISVRCFEYIYIYLYI